MPISPLFLLEERHHQLQRYFLYLIFQSQICLNTEIDINNFLTMTGDFNIRDISWNPNYSYHSHHSQTLFDIANSFYLELSRPTEQISTRYSDKQWDLNSVINLIFLRLELSEYNNHTICSDLRLISNHISLWHLNFWRANLNKKTYTNQE